MENSFYFQPYAQNASGTGHGAKRLFKKKASVSPTWLATAQEQENSWFLSPWFGNFYKTTTSWIYHADLGWVYVQSDAFDGLWLWTEDKGWLWTSPATYPHLFRNEGSQWLYFLKRRDGQARFYNHASGRVE